MKIHHLLLVTLVLLGACSTDADIKTPEDAATAYMDSLIHQDEALMRKVALPNQPLVEAVWRDISGQMGALKLKGTISYKKVKCGKFSDSPDFYCKFDFYSHKGHDTFLYITVLTDQLKVVSAGLSSR